MAASKDRRVLRFTPSPVLAIKGVSIMDTSSITNSRSASLISYLRHVLETDKTAATDTTTTS